MTESSAQLEREAERRRAELSATLDELRSRITPGQLVDQALDYARDGNVGAFVRNLGRDARDNPLPLALIGAGIAWLMVANGRSREPVPGDAMLRARGTASELADQVGDSAQRLGDSASEAMASAREKARSTMAGASDWMGSTAASASDRMSAAYRDATEAASGMAHRVGANTTSAGRSFVDYVRDEPLVLAGLGVALGAALGAALPATRAENRLMGETSDALKQQGQEFAAEQADKAADVARSAYAAAGNEAERQGLDGMYPVHESVESSVVPAAPGEPPER